MPAPQTFVGGIQGYSSLPIYNESVAQLQATRPGQYDAIMGQFIDPFTGTNPLAQTAAVTPEIAGAFSPDFGGGYGGDQGPGGPSGGGGIGGYSGIGDMFDGGGPGRSGSTFQGGGMASAIGNAAGGPGGGGNK